MAAIELKEIKLIIRSILISHKDPPSVATLCQDFLETEGREIPYQQLGHSDILNFLLTLKDTVMVLPDHTLKPVIFAEQQHIAALVSKQKNSSKRMKRAPFYQRGGFNTQTQSSRRRSAHQRFPNGTQPRARYSGPKTNIYRGQQKSNRYSNENRRQQNNRPNYYESANSPRFSGDSSEMFNRRARVKENFEPSDEDESLTPEDFPSFPTFQSHVILLIQHGYSRMKTYADFESVDECMEGVCQIYEEHLKKRYPNAATITYDIKNLFFFIDTLADLSCLVYQSRTCTYAPQNKDWIKNKIYLLMRRDATSSTDRSLSPPVANIQF